MNKQWIVVADAAQARIFTRTNDGKLTPENTLSHAQSRAHEGDLRTGGKGEVHDSGGSGRHQADPQTTTSEKHADIFAKQIAQTLKSAFNDNAFDSLVIAADPSFLGLLRDQLDSPVADTVATSIDKNWAQHDTADIERLLDDRL
ncbi:host attachment protein [Salinisphaera sp. T31B1]|uniref:host attachment protein n=1 Tax=Salinisphaera sp. T31B1 TaxID=727963 RepID=UPI0033402486